VYYFFLGGGMREKRKEGERGEERKERSDNRQK
jgi:hypothetical protein